MICLLAGAPPPIRTLGKQQEIGNHVSIGTNATILPVTICDHVVIGAGASFSYQEDITEPRILRW